MKIIVSPDSFKGTLSAIEAAEAMRKGVEGVIPEAEVVSLPVGDGGEGTVDALLKGALQKGPCEIVECETVDPLRRPMRTSYIVTDGHTAYMESASASGLTLLRPEERNILQADTYGTGLLIADAFRRGVRKLYVGMGGTATCDGGFGAYKAMKEAKVEGVEIILLCDVENHMCGPEGAAAVFGPQKGATPEMIPILNDKLQACCRLYEDEGGVNVENMKFAGAAGGLAGMLMACFGARPVRGIEEVLSLLNFEKHLEDASLVITGEGKADVTTLFGKAPSGILRVSSAAGVPVALIAGKVSDREALLRSGFRYVAPATPAGVEPGQEAEKYLTEAVARCLEVLTA